MDTIERPELTVDVSLTETALEQVKGFLKAEDVAPDVGGLRVSVVPGGCSGFKYSLNIEENALDDDIIVQQDEIRMFVDAFSAQYLQGTTVDYVSSMQGSGFTFNNPSATGGCGCGSSFTA